MAIIKPKINVCTHFKTESMKIKFITTIIILFVLQISGFGQHTDIKEFGLKGKVKRIITLHYKDVSFSNGQWMPTSFENINYTTVWHFNEQGFIDTATTTLLVQQDSIITNTLIYEIKNGKKISGKYFGYGGVLNELYTIVWKDKYTYTTITTDTSGTKIFESTSWLTKDFRDNKGEYKSFENGKVVFHEKYSDIFDSNGQLVKAEFKNITESKNYFVLYKHSEFDRNNNPTITTQINITDGTIKKMTIRRIEYYE
jgi:hypothetical protein